jgi:hypothetical protein
MLVRAAGEIEMYQKRDRNSQMAHYREPDWDKGEAK